MRQVRRRLAMWGPHFYLPIVPFAGYATIVALLGDLRLDHILVATAAAALAYGSEKTKRFFIGALPFFLLFVVYDALRYMRLTSVDRVLGCSLREAELAIFGIGSGAGRMTPNDFFSIHHHPVADILCAIPYGAYLFVMIAHWAYLYWKDDALAQRFGFVVLATHLIGFATYFALPAAPPWYVRESGCALALDAKMSAAALTRVDAMFGMTYFHDLYARGSRVFAALPSLHVTYPLYGLYVTWRRSSWPVRAVQITYAAAMMFAAVYLDHHYVWDIVLGVTYATASFLLVQRIYAVRERRARALPQAVPAPALAAREGDPST